MMQKTAATIFFLGLLMQASCGIFSNRINPQILACGESGAAGDSRLIKVLDQNGHELSASVVQSLDAKMQLPDLSLKPLAITRKGCIKTPGNAPGTLLVRSPVLLQSLALPLDASAIPEAVILSPYPVLQTTLDCPAGGVITNSAFRNVWTIQSQTTSEATALEIRAIDETTQNVQTLFVKPRGHPFKGLPSTLDTGLLADGAYRLEAVNYDPADGWESGPRILNEGKRCRLVVMHQKPLLSLSESPPAPVSGLTPLPWQPKEEGSRLYTCFEKKDDVGSCTARSECMNAANFKEGVALAPAAPGAYQSFIYAKDEAGNVSDISCRSLVVSNQGPSISLLWKTRDAWNQGDLSFMDRPYVSVQASIDTQHETLPKNTVQNTLECKVDFLVQGRSVFDGENAECLSGRCKGMSLGQYVPCDDSLKISLVKVWEQPNFDKSVLRLFVRAHDQAGHATEVTKSIWMNGSRWNIQSHRYTAGDVAKMPLHLRVLKEGGFLMQSRENETILWQKGVWQPLSPPVPAHADLATFNTKDGRTYSLWHYEENGEPFTAAAVLEAMQWKILHKRSGTLKYAALDEDNGVYLYDAKQIYHMTAEQILTAPVPEGFDEDMCRLHFYGTFDQETRLVGLKNMKSVYLICGPNLYHLKDDQTWENLKPLFNSEDNLLTSIGRDVSGDIFVTISELNGSPDSKVLRLNPDTHKTELYYFSESGLPAHENLARKLGIGLPSDSAITHDYQGRLQIGRLSWDSTSKAWFDGSERLDVLPESGTRDFMESSSGDVLNYPMPTGNFVRVRGHSMFLPQNLARILIAEEFDLDRVDDTLYWMAFSEELNEYIVQSFSSRSTVDVGRDYNGQPIKKFSAAFAKKGAIVLPDPGSEAVYTFRNNALERWRPRTIPVGYDFEEVLPRANGELIFSTSTSLFSAEEGSLDLKPIIDGGDALVLEGYSVHEDALGQLWHRRGSMDLKGDVMRVLDGEIKTFRAPIASDTQTSGSFFLDDRLIVVTARRDFFEKSIAGDDEFRGLDPASLGLSQLLADALPDDFLYASQLSSGAIIFQYVSPTTCSILNCKVRSLRLWNPKTQSLTDVAMPWNVILTKGYDINFWNDREGGLYTTGGAIIKKWDGVAWHNFLDLSGYRGLSGKKASIHWIHFDESGRLWIGLLDDGGLIVHEPKAASFR